MSERLLEVVPVTRGPKHHWFGYYDKSPWDASGRYMLAGEVDFMNREPTGNDAMTVGVIDLENDCAFRPVAESRAWCWQTGCMMQWLPPTCDREILYNDLRKGRFVSVIHDVETGAERVLPWPVLAVSHDGESGLSVNMSRLDDMRPGYGYPGLADAGVNEGAPHDDGIRLVELETGRSRIVVTMQRIASAHPEPDMEGKKHWVNHLEFNPDDTRFTIIHRWAEAGPDGKRTGQWGNQFFAVDVDGLDLHYFDLDGKVSHYDWRDDKTVLAWARLRGIGDRYALLTDETQQFEVVGDGVLTCDGHCSYQPLPGAPAGASVARPPVGRDEMRGTGPRTTSEESRALDRWVLTDTYPQGDDLARTLLLYHPATGERIDIGHFAEPRELWEARTRRCDLHPRWRRDGNAVCVDCVIEGLRHMAVLDVSDIVRNG